MAFDFLKRKRGEHKKPVVEAKVEEVVESGSRIQAPVSPVLKSFHVSEKATRGMEYNQYTFVVDKKATKSQVRDAVRLSYKVDVVGVNIVNLPRKQRTMGRYKGSVAGKKKAIVILKAGQSIAAAQP